MPSAEPVPDAERMGTVLFHFNVAAPLPYVCRLLRKAERARQRAWVVLEAEAAAELDALLWTFADDSFLAHARWSATPSALWQRASVVLAQQASTEHAPHWPLLINLRADFPEACTQYARVIEVVPAQEPLRQAARARWRRYSQLGWTPQGHDAAAEGASG